MADGSLWKQIWIHTRHLSLSTFISRLTGLVRDLLTASYFGATPLLGAFMVAFRLSNLFRRVLGEGALNNAFLPLYHQLAKQSSEKAYDFYATLKSSLTLLLLFLLFVWEAGLFLRAYYLGYWGDVETFTAIMLPSMVWISLYALTSTFLNSQKKFFLAGIAPALFNLTWIAATLLAFHYHSQQALWLLAVSVVIGYFFEWLVCDPYFFSSFRIGNFFQQLHRFSKEFWHLLKNFSLTALGVGAAQLNSALDAIFARYALLEGPCYLWYALRIQQLPLALVGLAFSTVSFAYMQDKVESKNQMQQFFQQSMRQKMLLLIPLTGLMIGNGLSGMNLLYGHGAFTQEDVWQSYECLVAYALGLWPMSFSLQLSNIYYRYQHYRKPSFFALYSVALNIFLNALFVFYYQWGALSVALSTSLSSFFNAFLLYHSLPELLERVIFPWKVFFVSLILGISGLFALISFQYFVNLPGLLSPLPLSNDVPTQLKTFFFEALISLFLLYLVFKIVVLKKHWTFNS